MLSEKENNASPFLSFCCYFCLPFCKERELTGCRSSKKELPVNKLDTFYEISFKTNEISKISFPLKFYIGDQKFSLVFPMSSSKINDLKQPFGLNPYSYFPRNQTFILEKYPYFIISSLFETHLTLSYETTDPLKFELDNNELNSQMFMEIFYNYLAFKLNEILEIDLNFSIYLNLTTNPNFSNLRALQKFSDYLIKFDQSPFFKVFYRKYIIEKTRRNSEYIKENEYKTINFLQNFEEISRMHYKANNFNKENELIIGNLQRFKTMKIKADIILINCYHAVENRELLIVTKELLIKAIFKALNLSKNIVILLHKTFPLELIPEIFDTSWSCFKEFF